MESIDALSIASLALAGGLWLGHHLGKATAALEYERGKLDGIRLIWSHYVALLFKDILTDSKRPERDAADRTEGGA